MLTLHASQIANCENIFSPLLFIITGSSPGRQQQLQQIQPSFTSPASRGPRARRGGRGRAASSSNYGNRY